MSLKRYQMFLIRLITFLTLMITSNLNTLLTLLTSLIIFIVSGIFLLMKRNKIILEKFQSWMKRLMIALISLKKVLIRPLNLRIKSNPISLIKKKINKVLILAILIFLLILERNKRCLMRKIIFVV